MTYNVWFLPEAVDQLKALYGYLAEVSSTQVAAHYVESIEAYCEGLGDFPTGELPGRIFAPACGSPTSRSALRSQSPLTTMRNG